MSRRAHLVVLLGAAALALAHLRALRLGPFFLAFSIIDLFGYLPGALAHRRAAGARISAIYYHLYNITHDYVTAAAAVAAWALAAGRAEWAMLAIPIHLSGDRALFGNYAKSLNRPFEAA
jgi:hypothetical protein